MTQNTTSMKKIIYLIVLSSLSIGLNAQQAPLYQLYYTNRMLINPAQTGFDTVPQIHFVHRSQWTALPGAPIKNVITAQSSLANNTMAFGIMCGYEIVDIARQMQFMAKYAYKVKLPKSARIDIGLSAGLHNQSLDFSKMNSQNPQDPSINAVQNNRIVFDAAAGINFYFFRTNIGFAVQHLPAMKARYFNENTSFKLERQYMAYASYKQPLMKKQPLTIEPIVLLRATQVAKPQVEATLVLDHKKYGWIAGNFRSEFGAGVSAGVHLFNWVNVGYGYEFPLFASRGRTGGSHELTLSVNFNKKKPTTPEFKFDTVHIYERMNVMEQKMDSIGTLVEEKAQIDLVQDSLLNAVPKMMEGNPAADDKKMKEFGLELAKVRLQLESFETQMRQIYILKAAKKPYNEVLKKDISYKLTRIYFKNGAFEFEQKSKVELDDLVEVLKEFSRFTIKIYGHSDNTGSYKSNVDVSLKRARMVYDYLVNNGIDRSRLSYEGLGPSKPLADNDTEQGRAINRRVEFMIIKD